MIFLSFEVKLFVFIVWVPQIRDATNWKFDEMFPHVIFATEKVLAKNCITTKTCFKCITKGHRAKFFKNDPNVQTCYGETFEKIIIIHETVNMIM